MSELFFAPLVVSAISAVLAALISVVDMIVNNYGIVKITINKGKKELEIKGGATLLNTLSAQKIFLPSACGGRGSCGACKCKVISDVGPHLPTETPYMTKEEIDENVRLSCQIKVKKDIEIEIPDVLFNVKQFDILKSPVCTSAVANVCGFFHQSYHDSEADTTIFCHKITRGSFPAIRSEAAG